MAALYQFEETARLSDEYPVPALRVHAAPVNCNHLFRDVAAVLEPENSNPCLLLYRPLGVDGVRTILDYVDTFRERRFLGRRKEKP